MTLLHDVAPMLDHGFDVDRTAVLAAVGPFDRRAVLAARQALAIPAARRTAVHVVEDVVSAAQLAVQWIDAELPLPIEMLRAPVDVAAAVRDAARAEQARGAANVVVVVARQLLRRPWHRALHDRTADAIAAALASERQVLTVVVAAPVHRRVPALPG
jgi:hypothetical protein